MGKGIMAAAVGALVFTSAAGSSGAAAAACSKDSWEPFERQVTAAQVAFQNQDPAPFAALWSHSSDVALFGAFGGYEVGWDLVGPRLNRVSAGTGNGRRNDKILSRFVGADVGVIVQLERITITKADGAQRTDNLRVTHVARCEASQWRLVHRHADPLMETKYPD